MRTLITGATGTIGRRLVEAVGGEVAVVFKTGDDVAGLLLHAARCEHVCGPMNAVAPEAVENAVFTRELARALGRPAFLPAPAAAIRVAMGELAAVVLASQRVEPEVALESGYRFEHPSLAGALASLVARPRSPARVEARA